MLKSSTLPLEVITIRPQTYKKYTPRQSSVKIKHGDKPMLSITTAVLANLSCSIRSTFLSITTPSC